MQITRQIVSWAGIVTVAGLVATTGIVAQEDPFGAFPEAVDAMQPTVDPVVAKRRELLDLLNRKVDLMNDAELEQALVVARTELTEAQATKRVREAEKILSSVVEEFPQTQAAQRARRMLSAPFERPALVPDTKDDFAPTWQPQPFRRSDEIKEPRRPIEELVPTPDPSNDNDLLAPPELPLNDAPPLKPTLSDPAIESPAPFERDPAAKELDFLPESPSKPTVSKLSRSRLMRTSLPIPNPAPFRP